LGFLGGSPFRYESQAFELLDCFGFPWILSSESRLFNRLRGICRGGFFPMAFAPVGCRQKWSARSGRAKEWDWSSGELNLISGFPQQIAV
jgi:hypothetical protein